MRGTGADSLVVAGKPGNAGGATGGLVILARSVVNRDAGGTGERAEA